MAIIDDLLPINERENTLIIGDEDNSVHFLAKIEDRQWLEVSHVPENCPGFYMGIAYGNAEEMLAFVLSRYVGYFCKKCNFPGLDKYLKDGVIQGLETEDRE